jgi:hypothetical protein
VTRRESQQRNLREFSQNDFGINYSNARSVALEGAVMDLHIGTTFGIERR